MISKYDKACCQKGHVGQVASITKGEPTTPPITYPTIFQLVRDCLIKPSLDHQYRAKDLLLDNIVVIVSQKFKDYLSREDVNNLTKLNSLYWKMVPGVIWLRSLEFDKLWEPQIGYANQVAIQMSRVDMATPPWSIIPFNLVWLSGTSRVNMSVKTGKVMQILEDISPHINEVNVGHVKRILTQGCPFPINFEVASKWKWRSSRMAVKQPSRCAPQ